MAHSEKPKVPPTQQHRSSGDTGVPQRGGEAMTKQDLASKQEDVADEEEMAETKDDPRHAPEEGEPDQTHRSHGRVIDGSGKPAGKTPQAPEAGKNEHWESGRHKAQ